jgi:hypothetical protein
MVNEYAIDPTCLTDWQRLRFVADAVGAHNGRLVSEYPKKWASILGRAINGRPPLERTRLEILYARITPHLIPSPGRAFDGQTIDWLTNAEATHGALPFHAIVAAQNPRNHSDVLKIDEIDTSTDLWKAPHSRTVPRTAQEMAKTASLLFQVASDIVLVDPHFAPTRRFLEPLEQFLELCFACRRRSAPRVRMVVQEESRSACVGDTFEQSCRNAIAPLIPTSLQCELARIREKPSPSEKIHNRYVLTDWGGLDFGIGLDDAGGNGGDGESDDVHLLDKEHFDCRWRQYALMEAFDIAVPNVTILGTKVV